MVTGEIVKDSDILKAARSRIVNGDDVFICFAIDRTMLGEKEQRNKLECWVGSMLRPHACYHVWLREHHRNIYMAHKNDGDVFRGGRIAWLDWMIAECEKAEAFANG